MAFFEPFVSFRERPKGGDVGAVSFEPSTSLTRASSVLLLIHGYNNDQFEASDAYDGWKARQLEIGALNANVVGVYWPGDKGASNALVNALFYMQAIPNARASAPLLADALRQAANLLGTLRVRIIAHSLGARLTMELLTILRNAPQPNLVVERFVVMAAAVVTRRLRPAEPFRVALDFAPTTGFMSLFSPSDPVLRFAFGPGETLAGEGFLPTALGHSRWTGSDAIGEPRLAQTEISGAHHGDYWAGDVNDPVRLARASQAASLARQFLDLGPFARLVASAATPTRPTEPPRETGARTSAVARQTPARLIAA